MDKILIGLILLLFILSANSVLAYSSDFCIKNDNISCTNCVTLNFTITTGSHQSDFTLDDFMYYNISVENIGANILNTTLLVNVTNPLGNSIGVNKSFNIYLNPNETNFITSKREVGNDFDIYPFDYAGTYTIEITNPITIPVWIPVSNPPNFSENSKLWTPPIIFYRFYDTCAYSYLPQAISYHFEVISQSDKLWRDTLKIWQDDSNSINNKMLNVTEIVYFLTVINLILFMYTVFKENFLKPTFNKFLLTFILFIIYLLAWEISSQSSNMIFSLTVFILSFPMNFLTSLSLTHQILISLLWQYILASSIIWLLKGNRNKNDWNFQYTFAN